MTGKAICAMIEYFGPHAEWTMHSMQVYGLARTIALREHLDAEQMAILECAAALHDVGIPESLRIFGSATWEEHTVMGAKVAAELLDALDFPVREKEDIVFHIRYHHDAAVYPRKTLQILFDAERIVDLLDSTTNMILQLPYMPLYTDTARELLNAMAFLSDQAAAKQG